VRHPHFIFFSPFILNLKKNQSEKKMFGKLPTWFHAWITGVAIMLAFYFWFVVFEKHVYERARSNLLVSKKSFGEDKKGDNLSTAVQQLENMVRGEIS
jgi:hypothetical protein